MNRTPFLLLVVCAVGATAYPACAQQRVKHLEHCIPAERHEDFVRFRNGCGQPVSLTFWRYSLDRVIHRTVDPGEIFEERFTGDRGWWMSSACPAGYDPDPSFGLESTKAIVQSNYTCISKQISMLR